MANRRNYYTSLPGHLDSWNYVVGSSSATVSPSAEAYRNASDYSRNKPRGPWLPPSNYSMQEAVDIRPSGSYLFTSGPQNISSASGTLDSGGMLGVCSLGLSEIGVSESFPSDIANRALIKARAQLKAQNINLGQAYAERAQTANLVGDSLHRLAGIASAIKNRNLIGLRRYFQYGGVSHIARDFPQAWLEFQYGWKPLVSDIYGSVAALDKKSLDRWMVTARGKASSRTQGEVEIHNSDNPLQNYWVKADVIHGSMARIDAIPSSGALKTAASVGLANPLSLAWELLPFSFVVDWAWPLGSYFDTMDAMLGWDIRGFSQSNFTRATYEAKGAPFTSSNGWKCQNNWKSRRRYVSLNRSTGSTVPFPVIPHLKDPCSNVHILNALSLLAGIFTGRRTVK